MTNSSTVKPATGRRINLYSDTQTLPTAAMRRAMAEAPVGDEQRGEDPSVTQLCERVAELLGKPRAVFLPSGTMCNEIAILVHCQRGDEIIADRSAHVVVAEGGGPWALAGAAVNAVDGERGVFSVDQLRRAIRPRHRYAPRSRLVVIEQTSNMGGGTVWPLSTIDEVAATARAAGLLVHIDGARLLNAAIASGADVREYAARADSVWIDLSKGLGCPVGAVLAGSTAFIEEAWRHKQRLGGAMRQAGILAAAGTYALEHHVARLADDHANARRFAELVSKIPGLTVDLDAVHTNIVLMDVAPSHPFASDLCARLEQRGVLLGDVGERRLRAVTHLDVARDDVEIAARALFEVMAD